MLQSSNQTGLVKMTMSLLYTNTQISSTVTGSQSGRASLGSCCHVNTDHNL